MNNIFMTTVEIECDYGDLGDNTKWISKDNLLKILNDIITKYDDVELAADDDNYLVFCKEVDDYKKYLMQLELEVRKQ